jgi:hypothetical protein
MQSFERCVNIFFNPMNDQTNLLAFAFRGLLIDQAVDGVGRFRPELASASIDQDIAKRVSLELLPSDSIARARKMATVYIAITAFESSLRNLVTETLLEKNGEGWWDSVTDGIKKKAESRREEENKVRWHSPRGEAIINYTEFGDLLSIVIGNWAHFEDLLQSQDWVRGIIKPIERSRNVIMHGGDLQFEDIERVGVAIRDWVRQVGI